MTKKFELNREGVKELMKSKEMQDLISERAEQAVNRLGPGYKSNLNIGKTRVNANVFADSFKAKRENAKNNTILKAVK